MLKSKPLVPVNVTVFGNRVYVDVISPVKMRPLGWARNPGWLVLF